MSRVFFLFAIGYLEPLGINFTKKCYILFKSVQICFNLLKSFVDGHCKVICCVRAVSKDSSGSGKIQKEI